MRILIVDDSRVMRMIVRRTLKDAGFGDAAVEEAEDGVAALRAVTDADFDLVLADLNMPNMSGIELLTEMRSRGMDTKLGLVTTEGTPAIRAQADAAGVTFLISKPFTPAIFQTVLNPIFN